jgi:uncharacterized membrane-anchored protein YitT (DUF2179 family)
MSASPPPRFSWAGLKAYLAHLDWRATLWDYLQMTVGALSLALAYNLFFVPASVVSGGISGVGIIAYHLLGWPVGLVTLSLNIPLFIANLRWGGGIKSGIRTIYAVTVMSLAIDLTAPLLPTVTDNPLLVVAYGGLLDGLGVGLVLRARGTTGGTDIVAWLLRRFTGLEVSQGMFIANALIIGAAAWVFGLEQALYGVMVAAVSAWAVDFVLAGGRRARQALIISEKWPLIRDALLKELQRGVTIIEGEGAYTGTPRPVLMCVISPREVASVRQLVQAIDPQAFVIISAATEVWGEGFGSIHSQL